MIAASMRQGTAVTKGPTTAATPAATRVPATEPRRGHRRYVLAVLIVVYAFNFIDRQIIGMLAVPIKRDLGLSDTELGLMGGFAFAIFYTLLALPVARLADRGRRTRVIGVALALWSVMTAVCGLAQSFAQLFLARVGVGIGEAGGVAPAHSLIADVFPPAERARALALYALAVPLGSALGIVAGGYLATVGNWRLALAVVGGAGLLFAPLVLATLPEPPRPAAGSGETFASALAALIGTPSFVALAFGAGIASIAGYGLFFWLPSFFVRSFGLSVFDASLAFAGLLVSGGAIGIHLGGVLGDRLARVRPRRLVLLPALTFLATAPAYLLAVRATSLPACLALLVPATGLGLCWLGPSYAAVQRLAGPSRRATAAAAYLFVVNLLGLGLGATVIGWLSDRFAVRAGVEALRMAILAVLVCYPCAALLYGFAATRFEAEERGG